jgi:DNA-binding transcriptional MerR regulator
VLRVWERRYGAVAPLRTPKGTRRYRLSDVERLQLLRAAVASGRRIGAVVSLDDRALAAFVNGQDPKTLGSEPLERALAAIAALDVAVAERVISDQMLALGPVRFAREFALPLIRAVGSHWFEGRLCIAAEHMASALLRSLLGAALRPPSHVGVAPVIVFATLPGERHELGLLISALVATAAGAIPVYLGAELPGSELARAADLARARAVALAITHPGRAAPRNLAEARSAIASGVEIWLGGPAASKLEHPAGVTLLATLEDFERHVHRLHEERALRRVGRPRGVARAARGRDSRRR